MTTRSDHEMTLARLRSVEQELGDVLTLNATYRQKIIGLEADLEAMRGDRGETELAQLRGDKFIPGLPEPETRPAGPMKAFLWTLGFGAAGTCVAIPLATVSPALGVPLFMACCFMAARRPRRIGLASE